MVHSKFYFYQIKPKMKILFAQLISSSAATEQRQIDVALIPLGRTGLKHTRRNETGKSNPFRFGLNLRAIALFF